MPINYLKKIRSGAFDECAYRISPPAAVAAVIEGFYVFAREAVADTHLVFNDGFPVLVFLPRSTDAVTVTGAGGRREIKGVWACAGAIKNAYVTFGSHTDAVFVVRFHPKAFYAVFGLETRHFRYDPVIAFADIAGRNHFDLAAFFACNAVAEKVAFVAKYVQQSAATAAMPQLLDQALDYIHKSKGHSTVKSLTDNAGVSYKWLERNFVKCFGLLPKEYLQLHRFIHAYGELVGSREVDLMGIAVSSGYYDTNHFLKDFKTYTGKTPLAYLKSH